jgi:uncharacterized protein
MTAAAPTSLVDDLMVGAEELRETHISWVLLFERTVFKLKKPVNFGFLDFSTLERRRAACEAEVTLNARLAPGVYRGVVPILRDGQGRHRFGSAPTSTAHPSPEPASSAQIVDWAVEMLRLRDEDCADQRLAAGRLGGEDLERLASSLSRFHAQARTGPDIDTFGSVAAIGLNVRENFEQAHTALGRVATELEVQQVEKQQLDFSNANGALFQERISKHRIRDGHGDLRLEHAYLHADEPPKIIDCIEFNERFRFADVCADVAFLSMDLAWHGRTDLAETFLAAYARESDDYDLYSVVNFYESYRAYVRAKICAIGYSTPGLGSDKQRRLEQDARRYLLLALAAERQSIEPARLIAVGGVIASGKSTVAEALGRALATPVLSSDRTRKTLLGVPATSAVFDDPWQGAYSDATTEQVYAEVLRRANVVLGSGRTVIIDASFRTRSMRAQAQQLARAHGAAFLFVECRAPIEVNRRRLEQRARGPSISDGRLDVLDEFVQRYEPVVELDGGEHLIVDSAGPVSESLEQLARAGLLVD